MRQISGRLGWRSASVSEETLDDVRRMLDRLYEHRRSVPRAEVLRQTDLMCFPPDVASLFRLLPSGDYTRRRLVDQLNSAIVGHGMGRTLGTLD
jgi:hypothetical protein